MYPNVGFNPYSMGMGTMGRMAGMGGLGGLGKAGGAASGIGKLGGLAKGVNWGGLFSGASKTLGFVNQAVPAFYQVKPIWNNMRTMFRVAKEVNSPENYSKTMSDVQQKVENIKEQKKEVNTESNSSIKFFI